MKNRRNVIIAFLLCVSLVVGVGYAKLTDTLRLDGTANVKFENANHVFDGAVVFDTTITQGSSNPTLDTIEYSADSDIATLSVNSLTVEGTTATFKLVIMNHYQEAIYATPTIDTSSMLFDSTLIKISSNWAGATKMIPAGGAMEYILTIDCLRTIEADETTSFQIGFAVSDTEPAATP